MTYFISLFIPTARYAFIVMLLVMSCFVSPAAAREDSILAVVGDDIITSLDVDNRFQLLVAAQVPDSDVKAKLTPQIIQKLIDERLIGQEAKRLNIAVSKEEILHAISVIEKQNNVQEGKLDAFLHEKNIPKEEFFAQLKSQILWTKVINYTVRPKITISKAAISDQATHVATGEATVGLRQILVPVQKTDTKETVSSRAAKLDGMRKNINSCSDIDAAASAINAQTSPDILEVQLSNLQQGLREMIKDLPVGKASAPFVTPAGLQVLVVCSSRNVAASAGTAVAMDKAQAGEALMQKQLEQQAKRYLRDLKQKTYVEIMS